LGITVPDLYKLYELGVLFNDYEFSVLKKKKIIKKKSVKIKRKIKKIKTKKKRLYIYFQINAKETK